MTDLVKECNSKVLFKEKADKIMPDVVYNN